MTTTQIPYISLPLEDYIFLLVCKSRYNYAVISNITKDCIQRVNRWEEYCAIEPQEDTDGLWKLWRLDQWSIELTRRAKLAASAIEARKIANNLIERRARAILKLQTLNPSISESVAAQIVDWCLADVKGMEPTKQLLNL